MQVVPRPAELKPPDGRRPSQIASKARELLATARQRKTTLVRPPATSQANRSCRLKGWAAGRRRRCSRRGRGRCRGLLSRGNSVRGRALSSTAPLGQRSASRRRAPARASARYRCAGAACAYAARFVRAVFERVVLVLRPEVDRLRVVRLRPCPACSTLSRSTVIRSGSSPASSTSAAA